MYNVFLLLILLANLQLGYDLLQADEMCIEGFNYLVNMGITG
jgi:hypothetical protein